MRRFLVPLLLILTALPLLAAHREVQNVATTMGRFMSGATEEERRRKAGVLFSGMSGTLAVARAVSDDQLRRTILSAARRIYIEAFASGS